MDSNHNKLHQKQLYYRYTKWECGESRIRTHGPVSQSPDFKSGAIDQLYHLSFCLSFQAVKQILQLNGLDAIWERAAYSVVRTGFEPVR